MKLVMLLAAVVFFISGCDPRYGVIESEFQLAPESRLPRWFDLPGGFSRKDLTMTITLYSFSSKGRVKIILYGPAPEHKKIMEKVGIDRWHPLTEKQGYDKYPNYSIITIDGIEEVFEQKKPEPFLYITDDPRLTNILNKPQDKGTNKGH